MKANPMGLDGFEFVERVHRLPGHQDVPVFFITSHSGQKERDRADSLGIQSFFEKPIDAERLIEALDTHCLSNPIPEENPVEPQETPSV